MIDTLLVDADILCYRHALSVQSLDMGDDVFTKTCSKVDLCNQLDSEVKELLKDTGCKDVVMALSLGRSFRESLFPTYKEKRHAKARPVLLDDMRQHVEKTYVTKTVNGLEGDDILGINQVIGKTCIASLDKDLLQIPGRHYNWKTKLTREIGWMEGLVNLFTQILMGDSCDEYSGAPGIGKVKAKKIISDATAVWLKDYRAKAEMLEIALWEETLKVYRDEVSALTMARMAYILRDGDITPNGDIRLWIPPKKRMSTA